MQTLLSPLWNCELCTELYDTNFKQQICLEGKVMMTGLRFLTWWNVVNLAICKNVDTERIRKMFSDIVFHLFSSKILILQCNIHSLTVKFRHFQYVSEKIVVLVQCRKSLVTQNLMCLSQFYENRNLSLIFTKVLLLRSLTSPVSGVKARRFMQPLLLFMTSALHINLRSPKNGPRELNPGSNYADSALPG